MGFLSKMFLKSQYLNHLICGYGKMKISICFLIILLLTALQFINVFIWTRSNNKDVIQFSDQEDHYLKSILAALSAPVTIDSSGSYRIIKWILKPRLKRQFKSLNISRGETTLVTQCSPDNLYFLPDLRKAWDGPISVSVFASSRGAVAEFIRLISNLAYCYPSALHMVSVHLIIPLIAKLPEVHSSKPFSVCPEIEKLLQYRVNASNYDYVVAYPNNLLRNVALDAAVSDFIFVIDIDMLPSAHLYSWFRNFIRKGAKSYNVAYVVPVFEILTNESIPKNRTGLLQQWNRGIVQPFYHDVCWKCQRYTDYESWRNLSITRQGHLDVGYIAEWHDPWEPFYIVPHFAARYDERFKRYGFNRISQSCELHVAGYQFSVLDNAFLVHHGFKMIKNFHAAKDMETNENRFLFRQFKAELKERYPYSNRRC